jgi:hypothetical protein
LTAVRIALPVPICLTAPAPEMTPASVFVFEWLKFSTALLSSIRTLPFTVPAAPPLPTLSVPR